MSDFDCTGKTVINIQFMHFHLLYFSMKHLVLTFMKLFIRPLSTKLGSQYIVLIVFDQTL